MRSVSRESFSFDTVFITHFSFEPTRVHTQTLTRVKAMVRVVANTSAWVIAEGDNLLVRFDETGAFPGVQLRVDGIWRTRPPILPHE
jgi:hypothetical protein